MRRAFKWLAGIFGVLVLVVVAAILLLDWNMLRGPLAERVARETGRDFAIEGDLTGELSLTPWIRARNIRLANAEWADEPNMAEIAELAVRLDLRGLMRGRLVVPELRISGADIRLETDEQGRSNWDLDEVPAVPEDRTEVPNIERLIVEDSTLTFRDRSRGIELDATIVQAEAISPDEGEMPVNLEGTGRIQQRPFTIAARGASLLTLQQAEVPYPVEVEITIGETAARLAGTLVEPLALTGVDVELQIAGPNPALLAPVLQIPLPSTRPYELAGRLRRDCDVWRFEEFAGKVGDSDLAGTMGLDVGRERPLITAELVSEHLDFVDLIPVVGVPPALVAEDAPPELPERLLPDAPLQHEQVQAVDAQVSFRGTRVVAPGLPFNDLELELELEDGVLRLAPWRFGVAGGALSLFASIYSTADPVHTDYDLRLTDLRLGSLLGGLAPEGSAEGVLHGRALFSSTGDTLQRALASADGDAVVVMGPGRVAGSALALLDVGFLEAAAVAITDGEPQPMEIRCFVAAFDIEDGVMNTRLMVLDTEDSTISGEGTIDLGEEMLDLRISGEPKGFEIAGARVPVEIGGRFSAPDVDVDPAGIAVRGALAIGLGALVAPLAAVVPLLELGFAEDSDCWQLIEAGERQLD